MNMEIKLRDTALSFEEISKCYNEIVIYSFDDDGIYDSLISHAVRSIAFLKYFCGIDTTAVDANELFSFALTISPHRIVSADSDLFNQWQAIQAASYDEIEDLREEQKNRVKDSFFNELRDITEKASVFLSQFNMDSLNEQIKKLTPESVVEAYNKSEEKASLNEDNIIELNKET